jgi:hypothetical protein
VGGGDPSNARQTRWVRVVSTGTAPLDLSKGVVKHLTYEDTRFEVTVVLRPVTTVLDPGRSAGSLSLSLPASEQIVASGLVTETTQGAISELVELRITRFPPSGTWLVFEAEATLEIDNARAGLNVRVRNAGTDAFWVPTDGVRAASGPVP